MQRSYGRPAAQAQRGVSLVGMMVAAVIGLFIVAGAGRFFIDHLQAHRRVLLEARLHQDLRAAADLIARDLRRAGYWQAMPLAAGGPATPNPYRQIELAGPATAHQATYSHSRDATEDGIIDRSEATGFRRSADTLQMLVGGSWQALTDPAIVQVTRLVVTPHEDAVPLGHLCTPACAAADAACPRMHLRRYDIDLAGRSATDPSLTRELHTTVRVRNDDIGTVRCPRSSL